jgi:hypothetical protein
MRRVGLIDITVGNATRLGASQRSATRRCASHHIATQRANRRGHPAVLARLAQTVTLKRLWLRDGHVQRAHSLSPNPRRNASPICPDLIYDRQRDRFVWAFVNGALGHWFSSLTVPLALPFYANRILKGSADTWRPEWPARSHSLGHDRTSRFVTAEASSFIQIEAHCAVQRIAKRSASRPSWWAPRQVQVPGLVQIAGLGERGRAR